MTKETKGGWRSLADLQPSQPFLRNVFFLEGFDFSSNIYLVKGDYLTLVDPANDYTAFIELFAGDFTPAAVKKVVLTHGHVDHAMGVVELLQSYPGVGGDGGLELIMHEQGPVELREMVRELGGRVTEVAGGEVLDLGGFALRVLPTPGHTADGICLYHEESGTLFSGDTVLPRAISAPDPAAGGDLKSYLASLRLVMEHDPGVILPGHDDPVPRNGRRVAAETYEGIVKRMMGPKVPWEAAARQFLQWGSIEDALYCCDRWLEQNADDRRILELKGMCLNDLGRFGEAVDLFDHLPGSPGVPALAGRAYALMGLGRHDEALAALDRALASDPGREEVLVYKGLALYLAGRYDEAMDIAPFQAAFADGVKREVLLRVRGGDAAG